MKRSLLSLPLVILMAFALGCQNQEVLAELEELKTQAELQEQNRALMRSSFEAWNKGSPDFFLGATSPDYVLYSPSGSPLPSSREETVENVKGLWGGFPDLSLSIEELIAVEDRIIVRYTMRGTHTGEFRGIPATGKTMKIGGIVISRVKDGKFIEEWDEFDALGMMQQLGMELRPAAVEE